MTNDEFTEGMDMIMVVARVLSHVDLDTMAATCARAESFAPIFMTADYLAGADRLRTNSRAIAAAKRFRTEISALVEQGRDDG